MWTPVMSMTSEPFGLPYFGKRWPDLQNEVTILNYHPSITGLRKLNFPFKSQATYHLNQKLNWKNTVLVQFDITYIFVMIYAFIVIIN